MVPSSRQPLAGAFVSSIPRPRSTRRSKPFRIQSVQNRRATLWVEVALQEASRPENGNGFVSPPALILFAHGSRVESANDGVRAVARDLAQMGSFRIVATAFLELGRPDLAGAVSALASQGIQRIVVIPYFLTLGLHMERDLPQLLAGIRQAHPGLDVRVAPPLEGHPGLVSVLLERAQ